MERCLFCGWTRRTAFPSIRFFTIPREPGMKKMMWMHAINKKCASDGKVYEPNARDRVCSVHFRLGRSSNDMSHEDFAPHLYLNDDPPQEVLSYLENVAGLEGSSKIRVFNKDNMEAVQNEYKARINHENPRKMEVSKVFRPSILQRKRKAESSPESEDEPDAVVKQQDVDDEEKYADCATDLFAAAHPDQRMAANMQPRLDTPNGRNVRLQKLSRAMIDRLDARPGMTCVIKGRVLMKKS